MSDVPIRYEEIYVCVDVETSGPVPGLNSMLSLAAAAYVLEETPTGERKKRLLDTFSVNLKSVPGCGFKLETKEFWELPENREAWEALLVDPQDPMTAMQDFVEWVDALPGRPVFCAYPVAFDFSWVDWYIQRYADHSPFGHAALDIKTAAMMVRGSNFYGWGRRDLPEGWFDGLPHTHIALDDAIEQGALLCNILIANDHLHGCRIDYYGRIA